MSDITGPPLPKVVDPASRTGKAGSVSKDPHRPDTQARNDKGDTSSKNEQADHLRGREPAVSIAASAAHLEVGEHLKEKVRKIDYEGRPIIVTEEATFALRPDAGLKPGDDVKLEIVAAGKKVAADLLEKNGHNIDPPIRLALIVIAIHSHASPPAIDDEASPLPQNAPSYAPQGFKPRQPTVTQAQAQDALTEVLLPKASRVIPAPAGAPPAETTRNQPATSTVAPTASEYVRQGLTARSSSEDLATLIASQQSSSVPTKGYVSPPFAAKAGLPPSAAPHHLIPQSPLTEIQANLTIDDQTGLGTPVKVFSITGQPHTLQVIDPAVSSVPPQLVAEVQAVRPLPSEQAKTIPLPITAFDNSTATLAVVDTDKGAFVTALGDANALVGSLVKVAPVEDEARAVQTPPSQTYKAKLLPTGKAEQRPVSVSIQNAAEAPQNVGVKIKAVHTVRAFLSQNGPMSDLRLETARGDLLITLPNTARPFPNDIVQFWEEAARSPAAPLSATSAPSGSGSLAASTALATVGAHSWPTLEQSFATIAGASPEAASELAGRSASTGGKLTNSLMFFLSAAGRGGPDAWLGQEAERVLAQQNRGLLETLKGELSRLMGAAADTTADWRPILLPMDMRSNDMPLIAMLLGQPHRPLDQDSHRGGRDGGHAEDGEETQRFVMEVQFSVLGPLQLDGLINGHQFDLAMRSRISLPTEFKQEAKHLFDSALAASGFSGQLSVIENTEFPVDVEEVLAQSLADHP